MQLIFGGLAFALQLPFSIPKDIKRIKQLRVEAVLNPDLALTLMKEAPKQPNRDAAAILALRLRQMSMAGILGAQRSSAQ